MNPSEHISIAETVEDLVALMELERLELDLFRGIESGGETSMRIFGGHVVAQTLAAAYHTVETRLCHSLHAYFMRPGDPSIPVVYSVDCASDGGSLTTRRVIALQCEPQAELRAGTEDVRSVASR